MKSYIQKIRSKLGREKFIHPAARIIIENERQEILVLERTDNGQIGLPAGALEEGETIAACIKREVWEETGLEISELTLIGISSDPKIESVTYPNGDQIQYFTIEFYTNQWQGELQVIDTEEVKRAAFMPKIEVLTQLPPNELSAFDSLQHYRDLGQVRLA